MAWDGEYGFWVKPVSLNLNSNAIETRPPYCEFDDQERCIRLQTCKKLLPENPDIVVQVNGSILELKEDWYREFDSSASTIVFPCEEIFEHREYEENTFKINIGSYEEIIKIPPKIETLEMGFSSIGIEKSILGQIILKLTGIVFQSDFQSEGIPEIRLHLEDESTINFLEKISRAEIIELSEIRERFKLPDIQKLANVENMQILLQDGEPFSAPSCFDSLFGSKDSANYYCASFKEGKIRSTNIHVRENSFSIRVGQTRCLTLYMLKINHSQEPSVIRVLENDSSSISPESIPMYSDAKANSNTSSAPSFNAIHYHRELVNFIRFKTLSNGPHELMLEVTIGKTPIIFEIPSARGGVNLSLIIIPRKLRFKGREYDVSIDNIQFVGDGERHMCISAEEMGLNSEIFNEIDNDLKIDQCHTYHKGSQRRITNPEIVLWASKLDHRYYLGGYDERFQKISGKTHFAHEKLSLGMDTEIHLLSSKVYQ